MLAPSEIEAIAGLPINRDESAPQVGQTWAWRSGDGSLVGVTVLQWGRRITPPRFGCVKVRFPDGQPEAEGWVRPDRLVSRWEELDSYLAKQAAWERVSAANPRRTAPKRPRPTKYLICWYPGVLPRFRAKSPPEGRCWWFTMRNI